jgi:hypothetical protein
MLTEVTGLGIPEESKQEHTGRKLNIIMFILLCLLLAGLGFFAYAKSHNIDLGSLNIFKSNASSESNSGKESLKLQYDTREHTFFDVQNGTIIKYTKDSIKGISKNGEELWTIQLTMANPFVKVSDNGVLIADIGGKDIYVIEDGKIKWNKKLDDNIINACISKKGYVTVVHEAKGYRNAVTAFDLHGGKYFTRYINETNVLSAIASPTGKQVLINSVDTSGVTADSSIELTDIYGKPLAKLTNKDSILAYAGFIGNENIIAAGDSRIVFYDKDHKEKWSKDFKNSEVYSARTVSDKYIAAVVGGEDANGSLADVITLKIINTDGKQAAEYKINSEVKGIEAYDGVIAVNTGREVLFINTSGRLEGKFTGQNDITEVRFFNRSEALIVTKTDIEIVNVN